MSLSSTSKLSAMFVVLVTTACGRVAVTEPDASTAAVDAEPVADAGIDGPPAMVTLAISRVGQRSGTITSSPEGIDCGDTCTLTVPAGTSITLHATPASSAQFTGWSGGGCSGTDDCALALTADVAVTATFDPAIHMVDVVKTGGGNGTVSSNPAGIDCGTDCSEGIPDFTPVTLVASPGADSTFLGWAGGGCTGTGACTMTVITPVTVQAAFVKNSELIVARLGNGSGKVTAPPGIDCGTDCAETYPPNTSVTLAASPDTGSTFTGWGGACSGTGTCTVTLDAAKMVTATFSLVKYTLSVSRSGNGAGTVTSNATGIDCGNLCTQTFNYGTTVTLTAKPAIGSTFSGWTGACSGTSTCTVAMTAARSVTATFVRRGLLYTIRQTDDVLRRLDPESLQYATVGSLGFDYAFGDCAWNSANATLYMVSSTTQVLYRVSTTNGAATAVGTHGIAQLRALAFHPPSGRLYAIGTGKQLYSINPSTAAATYVGATVGVDGLAWDSKRGRMVGLEANIFGAQLYTINLTNGAATQLAAAGAINNNGLTYDPVIDRYWAVENDGRLFQYDPTANMARTTLGTLQGEQTCITFQP